jgi:probable rRNA maturation factor
MSVQGDRTPRHSESGKPADPEAQERLLVSIVRQEADWSAFAHAEDAVQAAAVALACDRGEKIAGGSEVGIVLAGDALVRKLNATYRGKDCATNVLSFPFQVPAGSLIAGPPYLGDVVLAAETILREAHEQGIAPVAHLQHLVVHGVLHLLGFDHDTDATAAHMERLETRILATLGVADPYAQAAVEA